MYALPSSYFLLSIATGLRNRFLLLCMSAALAPNCYGRSLECLSV